MSKLWKGVKKVFKKVVKFVKKNWKYIVIAVAVYFTAGMALAAMPSTAAFSAAMPGFGVGGMFSNAAVALGATGAAGSGIAGTIAANAGAAALAAGGSIAGGAAVTAGGVAIPAGTVLSTAPGVATAAGVSMVGPPSALATGAAATTAAATTATTTGTTLAAAGMTGMEKVAMASAIFQGAGALMSDDDNSKDKKAHARKYANSFGIGRDGEGPGWGGSIESAFGDKYGGTKQPDAAVEGDANVFAATPPPQGQDGNPFADMSTSEQASQQDKANVGGGYKNRNYMPS